MKCLEQLVLPAFDELDFIEAFPVVHEPTCYAFPETVTASETTCTVTVTVAGPETYNGEFCYAQSPWGLAEIALGFTKPLGDMSAEEATRLGKLITHKSAFTVTGHGLYLGVEGDPVHVSVAMGNSESPVYAKDLAKRIFEHDVYEPGMDVYLDGCNTGNRTSAYPVPFAKKVSDALYTLTKSSGKRSRVMGTPGPVFYVPHNQGLEPQAYVRFKDRRLRYISF